MYCLSCGKQIPDDSQFCEHCGTRRVSSQVAPSAVTSQAVSAAPAPGPAATSPQSGGGRQGGFGVLAITRIVLRALSEGKIIRSSIAVALQVVALLVLLGGLLALIQMLKYSFQLPSAAATIGGLVCSALLAAAAFGASQICLFRAQSIRDLDDSPFQVLPILSMLFPCGRENYAVTALALGVGGCLFIWFSGTSPLSLLFGLAQFMPFMSLLAGGGGGFLDGLIFLAMLSGAAFVGLVAMYAWAELVLVGVDIAINVRKLVTHG